MKTLEDAAPIYAHFGLTDTMLQRIGGIGVLASNIDVYLERAIWRVEGIDPKGKQPWTDNKPVSKRIDKLEKAVTSASNQDLCKLARAWCKAARPAFRCRNNILHGLSLNYGFQWTKFANHYSFHEEIRKRSPSEFHADEHTLRLIEGAFSTLFRTIVATEQLARGNAAGDVSTEHLPKLSRAYSIAIELEDLAGAVNHEKY